MNTRGARPWFGALALLALVACAADGSSRGAQRERELRARHLQLSAAAIDDPELLRFVSASALRIVAGAAAPTLVLRRGADVRAELAPDGTLHVWEGLLLRTRDEAELTFVLAHELAHRELEHARAQRTQALELDADAWAVAALYRAGMRRDAGTTLLTALLDESQLAGASPETGAARALLRARIDALPPAQSGAATADDRWIVLAAARRAAWLARDPAARDPRRRELLLARVGPVRSD